MQLLLSVILLFIVFKSFLNDRKPRKINKQSQSFDFELSTENSKCENVSNEYRATPLLTQNEYRSYLSLREYAAQQNLIICPKIRLADLVEPKPADKSTWHTRFNRIKAKHVDFVLCDRDMNVKLIVELDDRSHSRIDRQARDKLVDEILTGTGYKIIHIYRFDDAGIAALDAILNPKVPEPEKNISPEIKVVRKEPTFEEWRAQRFAETEKHQEAKKDITFQEWLSENNMTYEEFQDKQLAQKLQ